MVTSWKFAAGKDRSLRNDVSFGEEVNNEQTGA